MNYTEFVNLMELKVKEKLGAEVSVQVYESVKNNGTSRLGIVLQSRCIHLSPTIYLEEFYRQFESGVCIENLVLAIERLYYQLKLKVTFPVEDIFEFEKIKAYIIYRVINRKDNAELLEEVPFEVFNDLAILPYVFISDLGMGPASMQIRKEHLQKWNVSEEELFQIAKENTPHVLPAEIGQLNEFMYVVTNCRRSWGAGVIFYPGILDRLYRIVGENYYLLPSSVHEFILIPESFGVESEHLKVIVGEVNEIEVPEDEILSDQIYYYNSSKQELQRK